ALRLHSLSAATLQAWKLRRVRAGTPARGFRARRLPELGTAGWAAVAMCLCALTFSHATWDASRSTEPSGMPAREAAVTFDDLPVISVTHGCRGTHDSDTKVAGRDRGLERPRGRLRQRI